MAFDVYTAAMNANQKRFSGAKLKKARQAIPISRKRLADKIGCSPMSIYNWEIGRHNPDVDYLLGLVRELGEPMEYFYE